jgi:hypothetical protein
VINPMKIESAGELEQQARPWIQRFARAGFAAKGVVYLVVAGIAAAAALGNGRATNQRGALRWLVEQPFGQALLGVLAAGLAGYGLWAVYTALADPERDGVPGRVRGAGKAVIHFGLAFEAARLAWLGLAARGAPDGQRPVHWTARLLEQPFGVWLVGIGGAAIAGYGLYQLYRAAITKLDDQLELGRVSASHRTFVVRAARAGLAARGVVFSVIGIFTLRAALQCDPTEARDMGGALQVLREQAYGPWLLGAAAVGLAGYAVYEFIRARYRLIMVR